MSDTITLTIDGVEIQAKRGQTIIEAAEAAGVYIPRLCHQKDLKPHGSCRLCTVMVNGKAMASCTQPAAEGMVVENETDQIRNLRRNIIEMLFIEGNHFCMFCEKSGNCELQAQAYRLGVTAPKYPYLFPNRDVDASHPEIFIDRNRCIVCGRCVRRRATWTARTCSSSSAAARTSACSERPGEYGRHERRRQRQGDERLPRRGAAPQARGYAIPVGQRQYDSEPSGSDIEAKSAK